MDSLSNWDFFCLSYPTQNWQDQRQRISLLYEFAWDLNTLRIMPYQLCNRFISINNSRPFWNRIISSSSSNIRRSTTQREQNICHTSFPRKCSHIDVCSNFPIWQGLNNYICLIIQRRINVLSLFDCLYCFYLKNIQYMLIIRSFSII